MGGTSFILTGADKRANAIGWKIAAQVHARVLGRRADIVLILGELVILREAARQIRCERECFRDAFFLIKIKLETQTDRQRERRKKVGEKEKQRKSARQREEVGNKRKREREYKKSFSKLTIFI